MVAVALPVFIFLQRPQPVELRPDHPVLPGRTNPPLRKLDESSVIPVGAKLWFKTNRTSFGVVISRASEHDFANHSGPAVLVKDITQEIWMPRPALNGSWTDM